MNVETVVNKVVGNVTNKLSTPTKVRFTPALAEWFEFETFDEPALERAVAAAGQLYSEMQSGSTPRWLSLVGRSGTGKTHLARRVWNRWKKNLQDYRETEDSVTVRRDGRWIYWPQAVDRIRDGEYGLVPALEQADMVILDDIGGEYDPNGFTTSKLNTLANARLGKWTIITSNLSLQQIASNLDQRIADRMIRAGNKVLEMETTSYSVRNYEE